MIRLLMPLMLMLLISACGKTGELYLPDEKQDSTVENPPAVNGEEADRGPL